MSLTTQLKIDAIVAIASLTITTAACDSADDERIPAALVHIEFSTVGMWHTYGVAGALDTRTFDKQKRIPADFPYTEASATGFGGVLLVCTFDNSPIAYDLSCPVEAKRDITITIDNEEHIARCRKCQSTYDIFRTGAPLSGTAADKGYALTRYRVESSQSNALMHTLITR